MSGEPTEPDADLPEDVRQDIVRLATVWFEFNHVGYDNLVRDLSAFAKRCLAAARQGR